MLAGQASENATLRDRVVALERLVNEVRACGVGVRFALLCSDCLHLQRVPDVTPQRAAMLLPRQPPPVPPQRAPASRLPEPTAVRRPVQAQPVQAAQPTPAYALPSARLLTSPPRQLPPAPPSRFGAVSPGPTLTPLQQWQQERLQRASPPAPGAPAARSTPAALPPGLGHTSPLPGSPSAGLPRRPPPPRPV
jgi:hypothetical protein